MPIPFFKEKRIPRAERFRSLQWRRHGTSSGKSWFKKILSNWLPIILIAILVGGIALVGAFAWFSRDLPNPDKIAERTLAQSTKIYARDATTLLYEVHGDQKRTVINLEGIPEYAKWATIDIEDKDFYKHKGFNLRRIITATIIDVFSGRKAQGASTITQQFVKNAILTSEKSYTRKIREIILAYQLERKFSKDQILKLYFNEIPYGQNAYGIESASHSYFNKSAKDLTLGESALLAALPQSPTYYFNHQDDWYNRQKLILSLMLKYGHITQAQYDAAVAEKIIIQPKRENIVAPHFVFYVKELLADQYGEKVVEQGGLKVITTLDIKDQQIAEDAVTKGSQRNTKYKASNAALTAIDTKTGQILAMVGSKDYFDESIDGQVNVTIMPRQPGSSFKPFVYGTAFKKGYTPDTILFDLDTKFKTDTKDYEPKNYDGKEHGPLTMRSALAGSLNIPAVQTLYLAGISTVLDTAHDFGYTTFTDPSRYGLSLVLGGAEVKLLDHTSAYATLAREGMRNPPTPILRVEDKDGKILDEYTKQETQAFDQHAVQEVTDILTDNGARAYIFGAKNYLTLPDRVVAAKTGTTNDYRDAWTMGYTPSIAAGVWVGNNDNSEMSRGADGSVVAAPIWQAFMKGALAGTPAEVFHKPTKDVVNKPILQGQIEGDEQIPVDRVTGKRIPTSCVDQYPKDFIIQKSFRDVHSILYYVNKDNPRGPVPDHPENDPQFQRFEDPVKRWAQQNGSLASLPPDESCTLRAPDKLPVVTIVSPAVGEAVNTVSMPVTITVQGGRAISKISYYIDNTKISEGKLLTSSVDLTGFTAGFHTLEVDVTDAIENIGTSTMDFNYLPTVPDTAISPSP